MLRFILSSFLSSSYGGQRTFDVLWEDGNFSHITPGDEAPFVQSCVDVRNSCPPEHQEAFDAARTAHAIRVHG